MTDFNQYKGKGMVFAHTDGACEGNPGPGAWAAIFTAGVVEVARISGRSADTTNNRMELTAAIEALKLISTAPAVDFTVVSDSKYVIDGANRWLPKWKADNWRTSAKGAVKNQDLWQELDALRQARTAYVGFIWVRGHSGDPWNEKADRLASATAAEDAFAERLADTCVVDR
jgi:ribonuclease HI